MAATLVFNPFTGKFDYTVDTSTLAQTTPQTVSNGTTFTLPNNTQTVLANQLVTSAGGIVLTAGTAAITWIS